MKILSTAPTRIGLLGGGTDVNPYAQEHGGCVLSLGISLYHHVTLVPRSDRQVVIENLGEVRQFKKGDKLPAFGEDKKFDLVYAILHYFKEKIPTGFNLYDRFEGRYGSGLGSSGSAAVAIIGAFNHWLKLKLSLKDIALLAWKMEVEELGWVQGKQDQLIAVYGGINLMTFGPGEGKFSIRPLKLSSQKCLELKQWMLLVYTGGTRHSGSLQKQLQLGMSDPDKIRTLDALKVAARQGIQAVQKGNWQKLGSILDKAWENKKRSNPLSTNQRINYLYRLAKEQGALGGKVMGAGGEGHMFFLVPPKSRKRVINALTAEGIEVIDFALDETGLQVEVRETDVNYHFTWIRENFVPKRNWAVFIDRDGTTNQEVHLLHRLEDFELIPGTVEAIKKLNRAHIPAIVYHNASVVARGLCDEAQVQAIHSHMVKLLQLHGATIDAVFYCPHHPTAFNLDYISGCSWRKPKSGIILEAARVFGLKLQRSYVIGDNARDIMMGQKEKCCSILVKTGHAGKDTLYQAKPNHVSQDLLAAVTYILRKKRIR